MKNRLPFALLAASALVLAGCSSINTALNTSKQPSMEKLTPPSGQPFLTLEGKGIQIFRCAADTKGDRKSTRLNSSHTDSSRMPSSA